MANHQLFPSQRGRFAPKTDTVNNAGGTAYALSHEAALAQYAVTGCLNGTFYASAETQLAEVLCLSAKVSDRFLAQLALYCREEGYMKDMPALLCAILAGREIEPLTEIFPRVIDSGKMLRNFVQIIRSGLTGRTSLGSAPKRLVRQWLDRADARQLLAAAVGQDPSLADVVKMVHPKPASEERNAFFAWLLGKPFDATQLPGVVREYEEWKASRLGEIPDVPFQLLTALDLGTAEWTAIARSAPWHMTRMNLNTFARHGVFKDRAMTDLIASRLADRSAVRRARVFPYQLLAAALNAGDGVPTKVTNALQDAMEHSIANVPAVPGRVVICPDVSGSMHSPVSGFRKGSTSKVRCVDVAALVAAAMLRKNPEAMVLPFMNDVVKVTLNPRDPVLTNAKKLASLPMGGTNCSAPLAWLNRHKRKADLVVFVSDNESWIDSPHYGSFGGGKTETMRPWQQLKHRSPKARLVCLDIQPNHHTQAKGSPDILNIGGFSDQVFKIVSRFAEGKLGADQLVGEIRNIPLITREKTTRA